MRGAPHESKERGSGFSESHARPWKDVGRSGRRGTSWPACRPAMSRPHEPCRTSVIHLRRLNYNKFSQYNQDRRTSDALKQKTSNNLVHPLTRAPRTVATREYRAWRSPRAPRPSGYARPRNGCGCDRTARRQERRGRPRAKWRAMRPRRPPIRTLTIDRRAIRNPPNETYLRSMATRAPAGSGEVGSIYPNRSMPAGIQKVGPPMLLRTLGPSIPRRVANQRLPERLRRDQ